MKKILVMLMVLIGIVDAKSQLLQESFESDGSGGVRYTISPGASGEIGSTSDYYGITDGSDISPNFAGVQGTSFFAAQDTDGADLEVANQSSTVTLTFNAIDISGVSNLDFSVYLAEDDDGVNQDWDADTEVSFLYSVDGGAAIKLLSIAAEGGTNTEPAIDTDFDGVGDGTKMSETFTQFSSSFSVSGNSLVLSVELIKLNAGDEDIAFDEIVISESTTESVGFSFISSTETETDGTFSTTIPVVLSNYGGTPVDLSVTVTGGSAESGVLANDFTLNTTTLSFSSSSTQNVSLDIHADVGSSDETIEITLTETTSTGILISPSVHTVTIEDDEIAPLLITEIMYNPSTDLGDDTAFEFVEIYNSGNTTVELEGYFISDAFTISFEAGAELAAFEYAIIAVDESSYMGNGYQVFEWGSGSLVNSGETITLKNANGITLDEVTYSDDIEYPNGLGPSLSLGNVGADNSDMTYWIGSAADGGTPGLANDITVWTSSSDTQWATGSNWSNGLPIATLSAIVPAGIASPTIADDIEMASLKVETGIVLLISAGTTVVNGELILDGEAEALSGSSLVILGDETGAGNLTVFRNTTGSGGYSILGSPVGGATVASLGADYFYGYDEENSVFTIPTVTNLSSGAGFFVGYDAVSPSVSFTGSPVSGDKSVSVTNVGDGFNLVANPYAAAISMEDFRAGNGTNVIDGIIYLWDDGGTNEGAARGGDYITVSEVGVVSIVDLVGTGSAGTSPAENGFIASTQGFFVHATTAGNVSFTSDMQETTTGANADANHYRKTEKKEMIRLSVSGNGLYNEILIGFTENATLGKDLGLDALKLSGNELISFYSFNEDEKYAIQALPVPHSEIIKVQLGMDLAEAGEYVLSLKEIVGVDKSVDIMILDKLTGELYDFNEHNEISFTNSASVFASKRFELVLNPVEVLAFDELKESDDLIIFSNEQGLNIQAKDDFDRADIKIYSLSGAVLASYNDVDFSDKKAILNFNEAGLFVIVVRSENGSMIKKFLN
ncbi:MAG: lamin tail domain-containing protein [Cyclobacteriaceae bacterium]